MASFTNSGTIKGSTGVYFNTNSDVTVTNSGLIQGTDGTSIRFGDGSDTLDLVTGGKFMGYVEFGNGVNTFDFSKYRGNMDFWYKGTLASPDILNGSNLYVTPVPGHEIVIVDDAAIRFSSQPIVDLVNGITDLVDSQFDDSSGLPDAVANYAPMRLKTPAEAAVDKAVAAPIDSGRRIWAKAIGGGSSVSDTDHVTDGFGALVAGTDVQMSAGTRVGVLGGYSHSVLDIVDGSQKITGDTGFLGVYGKSDLGSVMLDFQVLAGASANASSRNISTQTGMETATANFTGWFIAPQVGVTVPVMKIDNGEISVVGKLGYIGGGFSGYTETGSSLGLAVGSQTIGVLTSYAGLADDMVLGKTGGGDIKGKAAIGVFTQTNMGGSAVPVSVLGFDTGGSPAPTGTTYGLKGGVNFDVPIGASASIGAGVNASVRNDGQVAGSANIKISGSY